MTALTSASLRLLLHLRARLWTRAPRDPAESGSAAVEYVLLLALLAVACLAAVRFFGVSNQTSFSDLGSTVGSLVP